VGVDMMGILLDISSLITTVSLPILLGVTVADSFLPLTLPLDFEVIPRSFSRVAFILICRSSEISLNSIFSL